MTLSHSIPPNRIPSRDLGSAVTASSRRRENHWVMSMGRYARRDSVYEVRRVPNSVHRISEREAAEKFSAAVIDFSAKDLQRLADKTIDTPKSWKAGRRCPHLASVINLARALPEVRGWLRSEIGDDFDSPQSVDDFVRKLQNLPHRQVQEIIRRVNET